MVNAKKKGEIYDTSARSYLRRYLVASNEFYGSHFIFIYALQLEFAGSCQNDWWELNRGDVDKLYAYAWVMFGMGFDWDCWSYTLYAVGKLTTTMVQIVRNDIYAKLRGVFPTVWADWEYPLWLITSITFCAYAVGSRFLS